MKLWNKSLGFGLVYVCACHILLDVFTRSVLLLDLLVGQAFIICCSACSEPQP